MAQHDRDLRARREVPRRRCLDPRGASGHDSIRRGTPMKCNLRMVAAVDLTRPPSPPAPRTARTPPTAFPQVEGVLCSGAQGSRTPDSLIAGQDNKTRVDLTVAARTGQQLFIIGTLRPRGGARPQPVPSEPWLRPPHRVPPRRTELLLFEMPRELRGVSSKAPLLDPQLFTSLSAQAARIAELRGWPPRTLGCATRHPRSLRGSPARGWSTSLLPRCWIRPFACSWPCPVSMRCPPARFARYWSSTWTCPDGDSTLRA